MGKKVKKISTRAVLILAAIGIVFLVGFAAVTFMKDPAVENMEGGTLPAA